MFSKGYSIIYSINISFVLVSDLCQARCQVLSGVEILNFFFFSYVTIHWFTHVDSCRPAKAAWSPVSSATDCGAISSFLLNDQGATYLISSQPAAQFLGFANSASFVENNEYCFIFPSLLTVWIISFKFAFLEFFFDGWWDYTEFISTVNCQRNGTVTLIYCSTLKQLTGYTGQKPLKYNLRDSVIFSQLGPCQHMLLWKVSQ